MTQELFCLLVGLVMMVVGTWASDEGSDYTVVNVLAAVAVFFGFCFFCYGLSCALGGYASHLPSMWGQP